MELPIEFRLVKIKNLYQIEYRIVDIFKSVPTFSNFLNKSKIKRETIPYYFIEDNRVKETTLKYRDIDGCCMFISKHQKGSDINNWCFNMKNMLEQELYQKNIVSQEDNELYDKYRIVEIINGD